MITPLPALDRTSPTFKQDTDTFFGVQIPAFADEANALRVDVNEKQVTASDAAEIATEKAEQTALDAQATAADRVKTGQDKAVTTADREQTGLDRVTTGQDKAATAADRVKTGEDRQAVADGLAAIADGPVFRVGGQTGDVPLKTLNGQPLTGAGNIAIDSSLYRVASTSNIQLVAADKGKLIDITSGTFTQTFAAAATLGDGWFCYIKNSGTGVIALDPNASETIDGAPARDIHPGEARLVQCDGLVLRTVPLSGYAVMIVDEEMANRASPVATIAKEYFPRNLNTVTYNTIFGASLSSGVVSLPPGIYELSGSCPASEGTTGHRARIFNATAEIVIAYGTSERVNSSGAQTRSFVFGCVVAAAPTQIRLEHKVLAAAGNLGTTALLDPDAERYSQLTIRKIA